MSSYPTSRMHWRSSSGIQGTTEIFRPYGLDSISIVTIKENTMWTRINLVLLLKVRISSTKTFIASCTGALKILKKRYDTIPPELRDRFGVSNVMSLGDLQRYSTLVL